MSRTTLVRFALLCGAACFAANGCGTKAGAPRLLEVPANIRPIGMAPEGNFPRDVALSAPAQYEQPQASASSARITEISSSRGAASGWSIREPAARPVQEPITEPAIPPRRSEFVPISLPKASPPAFGESAPHMPAASDFARQAGPPAGSPIERPQWIKPDGPGWEGPSVPSPQNAGRDWSVAAQTAPSAGPIAPAIKTMSPPAAIPQAPPAQVAPPSVAGGTPAPQFEQPRDQQRSTAAMQVVSQRAMQIADQATAMANRGMLYSAQKELIQALTLIAQSLDVQEGTVSHATALNAGMTALTEAREFAAINARAGEPVNIGAISANHRTPILHGGAGAGLSPVVAQQQYFGYAQSQLDLAAGRVPAGSQILYRLGRLQTAMAAHDADPQALREPQAIVFHQAALATDRANWLAANELGVLYARYGQLAEARQLLIHSVSVHSNLEAWHNLSVVHRRLGEADLAQKANTEWQMLAKQTGTTRSDGNELVRWIDPQTFAAGNAADARWPTATAARPVVAAQGNVWR